MRGRATRRRIGALTSYQNRSQMYGDSTPSFAGRSHLGQMSHMVKNDDMFKLNEKENICHSY